MGRHTPGPWEADCFSVAQQNDRKIEICHTGLVGRNKPGEQAEADAMLIAASPEMLEALQQLADHVQHDLGVYADSPYLKRARDVISKAINGE